MRKQVYKFSSSGILKPTIFFLIVTFSFVSGQTNDPDQIIKNLKSEFERVQDYKADV